MGKDRDSAAPSGDSQVRQTLATIIIGLSGTIHEGKRVMSLRAKIVVAGPLKSGKSALADFLATQRESPKEQYDATAGVRIQEFEASAPGKSPHSDGPRIAVEMWDTSGDFVKYQQSWPAMQTECDGCLVVVEAETLQSKSTEIAINGSENLCFEHVHQARW